MSTPSVSHGLASPSLGIAFFYFHVTFRVLLFYQKTAMSTNVAIHSVNYGCLLFIAGCLMILISEAVEGDLVDRAVELAKGLAAGSVEAPTMPTGPLTFLRLTSPVTSFLRPWS